MCEQRPRRHVTYTSPLIRDRRVVTVDVAIIVGNLVGKLLDTITHIRKRLIGSLVT